MSNTQLIDEKLDRIIAANQAMTEELKANGIIDLDAFSHYQAQDVGYGINQNRPANSKIRLPVINAKNKQSSFNASQIAIIKKYDGGYHSRHEYWYISPRSS